MSPWRGSADEARLWCRYAADLDYAAPAETQAWQNEFTEIARMLNGLRTHLSEN
jgi:four helix bundle protein